MEADFRERLRAGANGTESQRIEGVIAMNVDASHQQDGAAPEKMEWQAPELIELDAGLTDVNDGAGPAFDNITLPMTS